MKKRTLSLSIALVTGLLGLATVAQAAAAWSPARRITKLWTFAEGYRVFVPDLSQSNPAGCAITDYARMAAANSANVTEREELNKTVMAAFLAGKNVRLRITDASCIESRPVYYAVEVQE